MTPDNDALDRTYFIGGPPRIGKTILSLRLGKKIDGHVVSTDLIRSAAKKACPDRQGDLFVLDGENDLTEAEWIHRHLNAPLAVVDAQNKESEAVWPSLVASCNTFCEDSANHIVEGVALLPHLVAKMENPPRHIVYVGNTDPNHVQSMLAFSRQFPERDWMAAVGYSDERIIAMAHFVTAMSQYFRDEAKKYGYQYYEINDTAFETSLDDICSHLIA